METLPLVFPTFRAASPAASHPVVISSHARQTHTQAQPATCLICTSAHHTDPDVRGQAGPQSSMSLLGSAGRRCHLFDQEVVPVTVLNKEPPEMRC